MKASEKESTQIKGRGGARPGAGRPPGALNKATADIKEAAALHGPAALKALIDIAKDDEAPPSSRVAAAVALLDRGFGKPSQPIEGHLKFDVAMALSALK